MDYSYGIWNEIKIKHTPVYSKVWLEKHSKTKYIEIIRGVFNLHPKMGHLSEMLKTFLSVNITKSDVLEELIINT